MNFTEQQKKVIEARGHDILVSAAAGSGKTAVLVERILERMTDPVRPLSIDRLLVVTFTRAAAAQMRERIGKRIGEALQTDPDSAHLKRQEILLHTAKIMTIDSFCTDILREHFSEIDLEPGYRIMEETEGRLLLKDVADGFLEDMYAAQDPALLKLEAWFCQGIDDDGLEKILQKVMEKARGHSYPEEWLDAHASDYELAGGGETLPEQPWFATYLDRLTEELKGIPGLYDRMLEITRAPGGPYVYEDLLTWEREQLSKLIAVSAEAEGQQRFALLTALVDYRFDRMPVAGGKKYQDIDPGMKEEVSGMRNRMKKRLEALGKEIFHANMTEEAGRMQDLSEICHALADVTKRLLAAFAAAKRQRNIIDFTDLEQFALQILAKKEDGRIVPTETAIAYRDQFDEIMIDEYQDSNDVQELLLSIISKDPDVPGADASFTGNRFMVGDVKQSIYRFRLARQEIFMDKFLRYAVDGPVRERIDLDRNFRSRAEVLDAVNVLFPKIMRKEIGGVPYEESAYLRQGLEFPEPEGVTGSPYRTEILLMNTGDEDPAPDEAAGGDGPADAAEAAPAEETADMAGRSARALEAKMVADRIRSLHGTLPVSDGEGGLRPARYGDMVILLRSDGGWNEEFRRTLEAEGIPVHVSSRDGYFAAEEVRMVLELLRVLDNPLQDIPLYGVMRGFFGQFTEDEIARARLLDKGGSLLSALRAAASAEDSTLREKSTRLLRFIEKWRLRAVHLPVRHLLDALFEETDYESYVRALPGGLQREANLRFLTAQAASFEKTQYTGLFQFMRYIDALRESEVDYGEAGILDENADVVRIMTIHKSKGLEFPVCFVCGLAKHFNAGDQKGMMLIDDDLGFGLDHFDAVTRVKRPSLRKIAVQEKIASDALGEEIRVLYVAMTRAKEKLILSGSGKKEVPDASTKGAAPQEPLPLLEIRRAGSFLDLVDGAMRETGGGGVIDMQVVRPQELEDTSVGTDDSDTRRERELEEVLRLPEKELPDPELVRALRERFSFRYPHADLKDLYTKTTVTELKKASVYLLDEQTEEGTPVSINLYGDVNGRDHGELHGEAVAGECGGASEGNRTARTAGAVVSHGLTGAERGTAVHRVMELLDFARLSAEQAPGGDALDAFVADLTAAGKLTREQADAVPLKWIRTFLQSEAASRMAASEKRGGLFREQPFVMGIPANELKETFPAEETILIQGIIDVLFEEDGGYVILDYKTDRVNDAEELVRRYRVQLDFYARAVTQILGRPVREKLIWSFALGKQIRI